MQPAILSQKKSRGQRGQSLIEFTLVMPVLLLVATGVVSFGLAIHNDLVLTNAVNTGAQALAFGRGQTTDPCATAYSAISGAAPALISNVTLSYVINGTTYASNTCTGGASNMLPGANAQITATYTCTLAVFRGNYAPCSLQAQVAEVIQ